MLTAALQSLGQRVRRFLGAPNDGASAGETLPSAAVARQLYREIVAQARSPIFYEAYAVPDTPDGRFDMIALHAALLMHRLRGDTSVPPAVAQAVFDHMFAEFDESLREMGVGDLRVGKVVKGMARAFYGRLGSYGTCLDQSDQAGLGEALRRNVYRHGVADERVIGALADYVIGEAARLKTRDGARLLAEGPNFQPPALP
ncbi:ubiquinol-cytochrome C chaperone family protein [Defluviicoccus vanus]|uniref:Ubiquinol-cytochrome c chaperone domain-containing protein n=1 Tax=Defluviicoccus vanus TaxID=111831 RepID=A0A7H1MXA8_9PROT|nr:ubiquinol-cytochrome C chaperone family protein [Defluviicoccus vanus]QNT68094.1 hypothetical protein HQ394_00365 [Defluviicoccus vanus]